MRQRAETAWRGIAAAFVSLAACLVLATVPGDALARVMAPQIFPYEAAFRAAAIIVQGDIVAYDARLGATLRVSSSVRGEVRVGGPYLLDGSAGYSFLASRPGDVTAFVSQREGDTLQLWRGPTSGGLIWSEPGLLPALARAQADPRGGLRASDPRERLAAAYFLATGLATGASGAASGKPTAAELDSMIDSAAWGMSHGSPSTHQAAVETLEALGYPLEKIGIHYHPGYKPEYKQAAAAQLRAWWARRR